MEKDLKDIALHEKLLATTEFHVRRVNHPVFKVLAEENTILQKMFMAKKTDQLFPEKL